MTPEERGKQAAADVLVKMISEMAGETKLVTMIGRAFLARAAVEAVWSGETPEKVWDRMNAVNKEIVMEATDTPAAEQPVVPLKPKKEKAAKAAAPVDLPGQQTLPFVPPAAPAAAPVVAAPVEPEKKKTAPPNPPGEKPRIRVRTSAYVCDKCNEDPVIFEFPLQAGQVLADITCTKCGHVAHEMIDDEVIKDVMAKGTKLKETSKDAAGGASTAPFRENSNPTKPVKTTPAAPSNTELEDDEKVFNAATKKWEKKGEAQVAAQAAPAQPSAEHAAAVQEALQPPSAPDLNLDLAKQEILKVIAEWDQPKLIRQYEELMNKKFAGDPAKAREELADVMLGRVSGGGK